MSTPRRYRDRFAPAALALAILCLVPASSFGEEPVRVVASIFPIADLVRAVGAERVSVAVLLPAGASPHTFEPRPSQIRLMSEASVFFQVGAGLEAWAGDLARASGNPNLRTVRLSEGLDLLGPGGELEHGHARDHANPHLWLDPVNAVAMVERIALTLAEVDPASESVFLTNALTYTHDLVGLHEEIRRAIETFEQKKYVAFHPAWAYFARRYGLEPAGIIQETPGKEPTPRHLERIVRAIRSYGIPAVFAEPQLDPKAAQVIAGEAGVKVAFLDPLGGENLKGRDSYLRLMRYNLSQMAGVFGRRAEE